jgi:hypothetical protein
MPMTYLLTREVELAVMAESTYGTSPGSPAGTDMFKQTSRLHITPKRERKFRDMDGDYQQASILSAHQGRQSSDLKIDCDLIPSGNATTPTAPDIDLMLQHHFGTSLIGTAHTTTAAGSAGTSLVLTPGGGAASGIAAGQLIAVDVDATFGYEARRVISIATDTVTVDRAFSAAPATGRTVKVGKTYKFLNTASLSLYLHQWIAATGARHAVPGVILPNFEINCGFAEQTPTGKVSFSGRGMAEVTHAIARPTPTTAGVPLVPANGSVWIGTTKLAILSASLKSNNGFELRENESSSLQPNGPKRTGNNSRYSVEQSLEMLYGTGTPDTAAIYQSAKASETTPLDVLVQLSQVPGTIVAWCTPKFVAQENRSEIGGEFGLNLSGRAIGTTGDDEVFLGFL